MHNVEVNTQGLVRGWVSGTPSGAPGYVEIVTSQSRFSVAATQERPDVLAAGHTLFSGFCLSISASHDAGPVRMDIEGRLYDVIAETVADHSLLCIDNMSAAVTEGWIDSPVALTSLAFSDGFMTRYPDIVARPDVAAHKETDPSDRFGFRTERSPLDRPRFCLINGSHLHVFAPASRINEVAA